MELLGPHPATQQAVEQGKPIISDHEIKTIFSIIKLIHQIHEPLATELRQFVDNYSDKKPFSNIFINNVCACT